MNKHSFKIIKNKSIYQSKKGENGRHIVRPMNGMKFKDNYKEIISKYVNDDFSKAVYEDVLSKYKQKNRYLFCEALQKVVVKIGLTLSEALVYPCNHYSTSSGNLKYLCKSILNDNDLYKSIMSTEFNQNGNRPKHYLTMKENEVRIERIAGLFNQMINKLCKKINDDSFSTYKLLPVSNYQTTNSIDMDSLKSTITDVIMKVYKDQESKRESMAKSSNLAHAKPKVTPKVIMTKKSKKGKKTLLKHSSSFCNEKVNLSCRLLKDEGVAFKHALFSKKKIIMFGLYINYNSHYSVKKLDVYLKTKEGSKKLKGVLGENRYQINADLISNNTIDVIVRLTYRLSSRVTNYKEVKLQRLYN